MLIKIRIRILLYFGNLCKFIKYDDKTQFKLEMFVGVC